MFTKGFIILIIGISGVIISFSLLVLNLFRKRSFQDVYIAERKRYAKVVGDDTAMSTATLKYTNQLKNNEYDNLAVDAIDEQEITSAKLQPIPEDIEEVYAMQNTEALRPETEGQVEATRVLIDNKEVQETTTDTLILTDDSQLDVTEVLPHDSSTKRDKEMDVVQSGIDETLILKRDQKQ